MPEESDQQVQALSLRISSALRKKLESMRELASLRRGSNVTTSEVAKGLLESAHEDRLEVIELHHKPTESLLAIRDKVAAGQMLSRSEWAFLGYYIQQGAEAFHKNPLSTETWAGILRAFQAAYKVQVKRADKDGYYLSHLPRRSTGQEDTEAAVLATVEETIKGVLDPSVNLSPEFAARCLYVLLDQEQHTSVEALNHALLPYWPVLWRVAARGHYFYEKKPVRDEARIEEYIYRDPLPAFEEGEHRLSLSLSKGNEIDLLWSFPGPHGPMYPMCTYPEISEFRSMLESLEPRTVDAHGRVQKTGHWDGRLFYGYVVPDSTAKGYWFRAYKNGITFGFSDVEWQQVKMLFRRAWEHPAVAAAWADLAMEYGEL